MKEGEEGEAPWKTCKKLSPEPLEEEEVEAGGGLKEVTSKSKKLSKLSLDGRAQRGG